MTGQRKTPRLLTIMGSGETSPTMVKVHREILDHLGRGAVRAVLVDTPFGFQENKAEIAARIMAYFHQSLHTDIAVASLEEQSSASPDAAAAPFAEEQFVSLLRAANYVFSGPGSPTYALEHWRSSVLPQLLLEKLENGGAVTFASAAALTLGIATVPVYEIYKVGQRAHWVEGLGLLSRFGIDAAVIPHFNNAEGGTHDTRYSYLGERRLAVMERELPPGAFVLGIDEHTSLTLDLGAAVAKVAGLGTVTVRGRGGAKTFDSGSSVSIDELVESGRVVASDRSRTPSPLGSADRSLAGSAEQGGEATRPPSLQPLLDLVLDNEHRFTKAVDGRDVVSAIGALLELENALIDWSRDIPADDSFDRARASFRSMLVELGTLAKTGAQPRSSVVGPFVDALLGVRDRARAAGNYEESDRLRDALIALEVEVRDTAAGCEWTLRGEEPHGDKP